MDSRYKTFVTLRPETKAAPDHLSIFREFLAQLDRLQRDAQATQPRPPRRRPSRREKES